MVHLDKVEGQKGSMVLHEDGSIVSSTGELSSSEQVAQTVISLISHSLPVDFRQASQVNSFNGHVNAAAVVSDSGNNQQGGDSSCGGIVPKWNRVTVSFGDLSYVACLCNRKIHVVKRDSVNQPQTEDEDNNSTAGEL